MRVYLAKILFAIAYRLAPQLDVFKEIILAKINSDDQQFKEGADRLVQALLSYPTHKGIMSENQLLDIERRRLYLSKNFTIVADHARSMYQRSPQLIRHAPGSNFDDLTLDEKAVFIDLATNELYAKTK